MAMLGQESMWQEAGVVDVQLTTSKLDFSDPVGRVFSIVKTCQACQLGKQI